MRTFRIVVGLLAFAGMPIAAAHAGMLSSAPAQARPHPEKMWCSIVNVDRTPRHVTIDIMSYAGNAVNGAGVLLLPNEASAVGDLTGGGAWCRFTVEGSTKKFRATAIYDDGSAYTVSIPAL
jgi:hypothetical protein